MFKVYNVVVKKGHHNLEADKYQSLFHPTIDWLI